MCDTAKGPTKEPWKSQHEDRMRRFTEKANRPDVIARMKAFDAIDHTCPRCGGEINEDTDNFCMFCSFDLRPMKTVCKGCGYSAHDWMVSEGYKHKYCPMCGAPWDEEHAIAPTVAPEILRSSFAEAAQA